MKNKYAIDTSAWIEYFSKEETEIKQIIEKDILITSVIAIAELADKFGRENLPFDNVFAFIQKRANIIPLTTSLALEAGRIKKQYRKTKRKFGLADAIHIATSRAEQATFITKDRDFEGIEDVHMIR